MDFTSGHIIEYSYSAEDEELGPHSYDDPFNLDDLEVFPPLPSSGNAQAEPTDYNFLYRQGSMMNYKAALEGRLAISANTAAIPEDAPSHSTKKRSFKLNRIATGFKEFGNEIKQVTKALVDRIKSLDEKDQPSEDKKEHKLKEKSKEHSSIKKSKSKHKHHEKELHKHKSKDEKESHRHKSKEEKHKSKEGRHKSKEEGHKSKSRSKGKGKEEQKPSPRSDEENAVVPEVSQPYNVERTLVSTKKDSTA